MNQKADRYTVRHIGSHRVLALEKVKEAFQSVLPIALFVLLLCLFFVPVELNVFNGFLIGVLLLIVGMGLFTLGSDLAMTPIGRYVGGTVTRSKNVWLILFVSFLVGMLVTIAEPDLQVLAEQVPGIPNITMVLYVSVGVGFFLCVAMLRILLRISIRRILVASYLIVFVFSFFVPKNFLSIAFDAGGVTTGPMTVPFIMSLGIGMSSIRSDKHADDDSFGLVALASIGPVLAVMLLGIIYQPTNAEISETLFLQAAFTTDLTRNFVQQLPFYLKEVAIALLPIAVFFAIFQLTALHLPKREVIRICMGLLYTFVGLLIFLLGANVGFMPMGLTLGGYLGSLQTRWILVPIGAGIGYMIVKAEPAVHVLSKQVYEMTAGAVPMRTLGISLSISVGISIGLAMLRILLGIPILYFLIPGYAVALIMMPFVPKVFTAIAFDSGGVASGPMTAAFLLPIAIGACKALNREVIQNAFGVVAMVAMTPLLTIQMLGLIAKKRAQAVDSYDTPPLDEIIE